VHSQGYPSGAATLPLAMDRVNKETPSDEGTASGKQMLGFSWSEDACVCRKQSTISDRRGAPNGQEEL